MCILYQARLLFFVEIAESAGESLIGLPTTVNAARIMLRLKTIKIKRRNDQRYGRNTFVVKSAQVTENSTPSRRLGA